MAGYAFGNGLTLDPSAELAAGRERAKQSQLAKLMGQAYSAPADQRSGILGQVAQIDANSAMGAEKAFGDRDAARLKGLGQKAAIVVAAAKSGNKQAAASLYPQLVQEATGVFGPNSLSPQWDDSQLGPLEAFANAMNPQAKAEPYTLAPGSKRFGADNEVVAEVPFAPQAPRFEVDAQGNGYWLTPPSRETPAMGAVDAPSSGHPNDSALLSAANAMSKAGVDPKVIDAWLSEQQGQAAYMGGPAPSAQPGATPVPGFRGKPATPPGGSYRTMSPTEVQAMGLPQGTVAQVSPGGQVQIVNKPRDLPAGGQTIDNGDGTTTFIPAGKVSEGERNAAGFYGRMDRATSIIDGLQGYDPTNARDRAAGSVAADGGISGALARGQVSPNGQKYQQAAMDWVRAKLRKESGAAIGKDEARQEYENYFPVYGDSSQVIEQKRQARVQATQAMRTAAGGALAPSASGKPAGKYRVGQVIDHGGKKYRVTGGDMNDPDVEEVR